MNTSASRRYMSVLLVSLPFAITSPVLAQDAVRYFRQNCMSCHTIGGGRITGPDLKDVTKQKDRGWLQHFIVNPKAVIDEGDPYALKLREEARG